MISPRTGHVLNNESPPKNYLGKSRGAHAATARASTDAMMATGNGLGSSEGSGDPEGSGGSEGLGERSGAIHFQDGTDKLNHGSLPEFRGRH